jgi:hypothetical protein
MSNIRFSRVLTVSDKVDVFEGKIGAGPVMLRVNTPLVKSFFLDSWNSWVHNSTQIDIKELKT